MLVGVVVRGWFIINLGYALICGLLYSQITKINDNLNLYLAISTDILFLSHQIEIFE